ncbi:unnamed protein product [Agarophyton chilense]|eukprot:gb/GEZJ01004925.1/.p1 GENE.gb/GEZJ01004925.1/~~gb/GEZJ01004925.1/.p1  ORF type:complete len:422 (-),score=42.22 gb/GEZJ01004925.1/:720-1985(-)
MSTASLPTRYWHGAALSPNERRRQWLVNHGLLSPKPSASRRLPNIFSKRASSASASAPSLHDSFVHLHVDDNAVPLVVARRQNLHPDTNHAAARTLSLPIDDSARMPMTRFRRAPPSKWFSRNPTHERSASRSSRIRAWFAPRKFRDLAPRTDSPTQRPQSVPSLRRSASLTSSELDIDRLNQPPDRQGASNRPNSSTIPSSLSPTCAKHTNLNKSATNPRSRRRAVYKVVDTHIPRRVLKPQAHYEKSSWNAYRSRIDQLAENEQFMNYLTAPVQRHPSANVPTQDAANNPHQLAVNKLYPLAFIKLLEAQAKMAAEADSPCDPSEEQHRYDDIDGDDEARIERTASTGLRDMKRFRTISSENRTNRCNALGTVSGCPEHVRLLKFSSESGSESSHSSFFSKLTQDNHMPSPAARFSCQC